MNQHRLDATAVDGAGEPPGFGRRQALAGMAALGLLAAVGTVTAPAADAATRTRSLVAASHPTLWMGRSGPAVRDLQTRLAAQSYWLGSIDGQFGQITRQAVYALQKWWGISPDGIVGPVTWDRLLRGQRPRSRYGGYRIEIDKAKQLAIVVWGGSVRYTLNTSTGSNRSYLWNGRWYSGRTPSGTYTVFRHVNGWVYNALGALYYPYFFSGGIAIHGEYAWDVPPYNASHGCCRVSNQAILQLIRTGYVRDGRVITVY